MKLRKDLNDLEELEQNLKRAGEQKGAEAMNIKAVVPPECTPNKAVQESICTLRRRPEEAAQIQDSLVSKRCPFHPSSRTFYCLQPCVMD